MTVTSLVYRINADSSQFSRELRGAEKNVKRFQRRAESSMMKFGRAAATATGLVVTGLIAMTRESVNAAADMGATADQLQMTTEELSRLKFAARENEVEFGTLQSRLTRFNQEIAKADEGMGDLADVFDRHGISARDSGDQLRSQSEILRDIADAYANTEDRAEKSRIAMAAFGRRGAADMIPLLKQGGAAIEELEERAASLGLEIDTNTSRAARQLQANLRSVRDIGTSWANQIAAQTIPQLTAYSSSMIASAENANEKSRSVIALQGTMTGILTTVETLRIGFVVLAETIAAAAATAVAATPDFEQAFDLVKGGPRGLARGLADMAARSVLGVEQDTTDSTTRTVKKLSAIWDGYQDELGDIYTAGAKNLEAILNTEIPEINEKLADTANVFDDESGPFKKIVDEAEEEFNRLVQLTTQAELAMRTPMQQFGDDLGDLQEAWALGIIDDETFDRLQRNLEETLDPFGEFKREAEETAKMVAEAVAQEEAFQRAREEAHQLQAAYMGIDTAAVEHLERLEELHAQGHITWAVYADAVQQAAGEIEEVNEGIEEFQRIGEQAVSMLSSSIADAFVDPLNASFEDMATDFITQINRMIIETIAQRAILAGLGAAGAPGFADGGPVQRFASGGPVFGAGTATSDSIPAYLSNGEYVLNAKTTRQLGVDRLNQWNFGSVPGFAAGGPVSGSRGGGSMVKNITVIDIDSAMREYLSSPSGTDAIINVVRTNSGKL